MNTRPTPLRRLAWVIPFIAGIPAGACGAGESVPGIVVRDCAGVTIVENHEPVWSDAEAWRLAGGPMVQIGMVDGAEEYQLFRAWSAVRLGDGRIVVATATL